MKQDRDRPQEIMEMFHHFGQTKIGADSLREAIECGDFEANGLARNREEAQKLGQAMVEHGFVHNCNWTDSLYAGVDVSLLETVPSLGKRLAKRQNEQG
jgi:hypothetical protein